MAEGLIARIGHWCFRKRWWVLLIWVAAMVVGGISAGPVFASLDTSNGPKSLESVKANDVLKQGSDQGGTVVGLIDGIDPAAPSTRDGVLATAASLKNVSGIASVVTPFDAGLPAPQAASLVAKDKHALVVRVTLANLDSAERNTALSTISSTFKNLGTTLHTKVTVGGGPVINQEANKQAQTDLSKAEIISLPITLVVLVFVFGGIIAAGMPVLAAIVSVASSLAILLVFTKFTTIDQNAVTVVTLLGLGLSVDYGLLLVARYREELGAGYAPEAAVSRAWATAGRTIVFSALTVAAALSGMLMFGIVGLTALGAAGVSVAIAAMLVALTFTAALLGFARKRIRPSKRATARIAQYGDAAEVGFFAKLARAVQKRPLITAIGTGAALIAAGLPLFSMALHLDDLSSLPRSLPSVQVSDQLRDRFGQAPSPAVTIVARTDAATLDRWAAHWEGVPGVTRVYPATQVGQNLATVSIDAAGDPEGTVARSLVDKVRADRPAGVESWVTGDAAVLNDILNQILQGLPLAVTVTLIAMAVLLFAMSGSLIVPLKAIAMNAVSLGATFGVMNAVFEHGFLASTLHVLKVGGLSPFTVVAVFAFAFGLSMDYEVFLLGRIKEYVDHGMDTDVAVRRGLQRSGRIITSAALLMVIVFACFVTGRMGTVQQIGLGLAVAVAIDATIVRCVLVPATMTLLGKYNWWAPRWLKRVHRRIGLSETTLPTTPAPAELEPALS
jgi:RND superfamily putative drug exporter